MPLDPQKLSDENKLLKEQLELLKKRNKIQEDSFDISSSAVDSLKEILGIESQRSTFESATLKINKDINSAILNQKTGLSDISNIQKQIQKNEDLLKKTKLIEQGLLSSIGGELSQNGQIIQGRIKKQEEQNQQLSEYNKRIEEGASIDISSYNQLKDKIQLNEQLITQEFSKLSSLEQQYILTQQSTEALEEQQKVREAEQGIQDQLNKKLGVAGGILKGLGALPGIGTAAASAMSEVEEEIRQITEETGQLPNKWATFSMIVSKTGKNIEKSFTDPAVLIGGLVSILKELDDSGEKFARSMNMSYTESLQFRDNMTAVSGITKGQMLESISAVGEQLGSNAAISEKDAATFTELKVLAGMTNEELMGMQSISLANGKSLKGNTNEFLAQAKATAATNGVILNEKKLLADVGKISAATTLSLGKNPKELAKAAATAKALGMEMGKLEDIAGGLLDFEQSIENELSAELLTGKDLNLERARGLALNNDMAGMAEEINNQIGSSADYTKMNRIQQEALAKAVGMNREELAQTLYTQEQLKGLSGDEAAERQALLDARIEEVGLAQAQREMEEGGVEKLKEQAGIQTKFNQTILELKDMLASEILPIFVKVADFLTSHMGMVKGLILLYGVLKGIILASNVAKAFGIILTKREAAASKKEATSDIVGGAFKMASGAGLLGIALVGGLIGAGIAALAMADDMMSPGGSNSGYGNRTLFGPEGAIQLNNKDTVIAGTNLFGNDVKSEPGKSTQMGGKGEIKVKSEGGDMTSVISAIKELASRPVHVTVQLDGKNLIEAQGEFPNTKGEADSKYAFKVGSGTKV
jgi:hypothetical protein